MQVRRLADRNAWAFIEASGQSGWIKARNLHVQLVPPAQETLQVGKGFFIMCRGRRAIVGNTRHATCTLLRRRPTDEEDFNGARVQDADEVDILDASSDGDFALVSAAYSGAEGWIKTRNLHVQMV